MARSPGSGSAVIPQLAAEGLAVAVAELAARDADLAGIVARYGLPPLWDRQPGFATLLHIVLEQQVSLASARAAFDRLVALVDPLTPARFLALSDAQLLTVGFSGQKARYGRALAEAIRSGDLDLDALAALDDDAAHLALQAVPGIGPWTSTIYLLMVLGRPDVWPVGDIALASAVADIKGLGQRPDAAGMTALGEAWRPWRSVAARLLWHDYLSRRGRPG
ncbi:MAG: DNA-3-methyladenine glycosylase [Chloroflexota bacterium]|nr:DNA-3-methyladenine glycosylase [Chloroflexota bacterium]